MKYFIPDAALIGKGFVIDSLVQGETTNIPAVVNFIYTGGYYAAGDGGGNSYYRVVAEPAIPGYFQSADGAWWQLSDTMPNVLTFGAKGDDIQDDTTFFHNFRDYLKAHGYTGYVPNKTYLVGEILLDGSDYTIINDPNTLYHQTDGLTIDQNYHAIITINGSNISFIDGKGLGNIVSNLYEYSPFVYVMAGCNNIKLGDKFATDVRGDVVTVVGYENNPTVNIQLNNVGGENVYRNILSVIGGQVTYNDVTCHGALGQFLIDGEPNAPDGGGTYQNSNIVGNTFSGARIASNSADVTSKNVFSFVTGELNFAYVQDSNPAYPAHQGAQSVPVSIGCTSLFKGGQITITDYEWIPFTTYGDTWDKVDIDLVHLVNNNSVEAVYHGQFVNFGNAPIGKISIGRLECSQPQGAGYLIRSQNGNLNIDISGGTITGGFLGVSFFGNLSDITHDVVNEAGNIIQDSNGYRLINYTFLNAAAATLLRSSSDGELHGVTGTFANIATVNSDNTFVVNSTLNGAFYRADYLSSGLPNKAGVGVMPGAAIEAVVFGEAQLDANYQVILGGQANETFWVSDKTINGFNINSSNVASVANVSWQVNRGL